MQREIRIAVLLILAACATSSEVSVPMSPEQVSLLALEAARHTPEFVHFVRNTKFEWVRFTQVQNAEFPELEAAVSQELAKRYRVFRQSAEIPAEFMFEDRMGKYYRKGFLFSVEIHRESRDTVAITYSDYEGPLAASTQRIVYRWTGRRWKQLFASDVVVS